MPRHDDVLPPPTSRLVRLAEEATNLPTPEARRRLGELLRMATTEEDRQAIQGYGEALAMGSRAEAARRRMRKTGVKTKKPP